MSPEHEPRHELAVGKTTAKKRGFAVRDRILLYLTGMGLTDVASLELAAQCLRRVGPDANQEQAMTALFQLLREKELAPSHLEPDQRIRSFPPHNRTAMLAKRLERFRLFRPAPTALSLDKDASRKNARGA